MAPEYGATIGVFPIDEASLDYLRMTNRPAEQIELVEAYAKEQGLFRTSETPDPGVLQIHFHWIFRQWCRRSPVRNVLRTGSTCRM